MFGSLIINRQIRQLLACDDMQSESAQAIIAKLVSSGKDAVEKLLVATGKADSKHKPALLEICNEILDKAHMDVFISEMDSDITDVRNAAKNVLSISQSINPSALLNKLTDPDASVSQIIDVIEFQKEHLKPEQVVTQALKLSGNQSARLFDMAKGMAKRFNVDNFAVQPSKVDTPDKKIHLLNFLSLIHQENSAKIVSQFLGDKNNMVVMVALGSLKTINKKFDIDTLLSYIPNMKGEEKKLAMSLVESCAKDDLVGRMAPLLTSQDLDLKNLIAKIAVQKATTNSLRQLLIGIEKREAWGKEESINLLIDTAQGKLSEAARPLVKNEPDSIKLLASKLIDVSQETGSFQDMSHAALNENWEVREKAISILAKTKHRLSLKILAKVLTVRPDSALPVLKAVQALGFSKGLEIAVKAMEFEKAAVQREALKTIKILITDKHAQTLQTIVLKKLPTLQTVVRDTAGEVLMFITAKYNLKALPDNFQQLLIQETMAVEPVSPSVIKVEESAGEEEAKTVRDVFDLDELKPGVEWADRYVIKKEIGRGAMGRVLLAADKMVGEDLIVKFMHPELTSDKDARERFVRELKYARRISHPNVIRIHDFLYQQKVAAISMEYFLSTGLDEEIKKAKFTQRKKV
ncbi:MAG: protein kinase [Gammaproteobacteria bacterium]|nr:protein kinase [Gammaproteobacteria bacterium]